MPTVSITSFYVQDADGDEHMTAGNAVRVWAQCTSEHDAAVTVDASFTLSNGENGSDQIQLEPGASEWVSWQSSALDAGGYPVLDMTDNEMAKLHVRYMVGGHTSSSSDEVLYRFYFPERPGALLNFLDHLGRRWNISLFHYRNHGSDYGRVLMGLQVPPAERPAFEAFLDEVGYAFIEETGNPAYDLFLR